MDLNNWKGGEALATLTKEYYDLHDGTHDMSKLWPDIDIMIKLPVNKHSNKENSDDQELDYLLPN